MKVSAERGHEMLIVEWSRSSVQPRRGSKWSRPMGTAQSRSPCAVMDMCTVQQWMWPKVLRESPLWSMAQARSSACENPCQSSLEGWALWIEATGTVLEELQPVRSPCSISWGTITFHVRESHTAARTESEHWVTEIQYLWTDHSPCSPALFKEMRSKRVDGGKVFVLLFFFHFSVL